MEDALKSLYDLIELANMYIQQDDIDNNKANRITFASKLGKKFSCCYHWNEVIKIITQIQCHSIL